MNTPRLSPIYFKVSLFQYSRGREYMPIHTRAQLKSSLSGSNLSLHSQRYRPEELKKYGPPLKIWDLSSKQLNVAVKKPLGPSCNVACPLGFHLEAIHPCKAFSVGQHPINFPMSTWSFMNWIWLLILWLGRSTLIHYVVFRMQVAEDAFGCDAVAFWYVPFSLIAADPTVEFPAASMIGLGSWTIHGGTPGLFREFAEPALSEEVLVGGGWDEPAPPKGKAILKCSEGAMRRGHHTHWGSCSRD